MMRRRARKSKSKNMVWVTLGVVGVLVAIFVAFSPKFERQAPTIKMKDRIVWNLEEPLHATITDNEALGSFEVTLSDANIQSTVAQGNIKGKRKEATLTIPPLLNQRFQNDRLTLKIRVTDKSLWNFFRGNEAQREVAVKIDRTPPKVALLSHSLGITQGGSALVIFSANDDAKIDSVCIKVGDRCFKALPYKKNGTYVALIAWPFMQAEFEAQVVAKDKAGNVAAKKIPFHKQAKGYKVSRIRAKDSFIDGKITELAGSDEEFSNIEDRLERFRAVNEAMRKKNEELIHRYSSKVGNGLVTSWKIRPFHPLRRSVKVSNFGAKRLYYYKDKNDIISTSYHLGYDLASTKEAPIYSSNPGKVVYADYNGIYGLMPMIDHGMGLYSLYGHCSKLTVEKGNTVGSDHLIGYTGTSGLALGDHLHFGILVQGVEVRPVEWFDKHWIKNNITRVFEEADKKLQSAP